LHNAEPVMEHELFSNGVGLADGRGSRVVTVFRGSMCVRCIGPMPISRFPLLLLSNWHGKVLASLDTMLKGWIGHTQNILG
jgi:hypothetical protein